MLHLPDLVFEVLDFLRAVFLSTFQSIQGVSDILGLVLLQGIECLSLGGTRKTNKLITFVPSCLHLLELCLGCVLFLLPSFLEFLVLGSQLSIQALHNRITMNGI